MGLEVRAVLTDGLQPVGRGLGPALEARDVLAVLTGAADAPQDLRERALFLAGHVLELSSRVGPGTGHAAAKEILDDGRAWRKFQAICEAQGGLREPPRARYTHTIVAAQSGRVDEIDNRRLARVAKLSGAPRAAAAGLALHTPIGSLIERAQPLFTIHADTPGELAYALEYVERQPDVIGIVDRP